MIRKEINNTHVLRDLIVSNFRVIPQQSMARFQEPLQVRRAGEP